MISDYKSKNLYQEKDRYAKFLNVRTASQLSKTPRSGTAYESDRAETAPLQTQKLLGNHLLTALPDAEFLRLLPHLEPVYLAYGDEIYKPEGSVRHVYFPETAVICQLHTLVDGSTIEIAMLGKEGMTGISAVFDASPPLYRTQVTIAGGLLRIRTDILQFEFARGGRLQELILKYTSRRLQQVSQRVICNSYHTMEARLCTWLLMLHDRVGEDQLLLTQDQIATYLGAGRPYITGIAKALRQRGIVNYVRGYIRILDRAALERSACECYRIVSRNPITGSRLETQ